MTLKFRITAASASGIALTAIALCGAGLYVSSRFSQSAQVESHKLIETDWKHTNSGIYGNVKAQGQSIESQVKYGLKTAWGFVRDGGGFHLSNETVTWEATNPIDKSVQKVTIPKMLLGDQWFGQSKSFEQKALLVDRVKSDTGCTSSLFQRMNDKGELLRIGTTVKSDSGQRQIGGFISAATADGSPNPVVQSILNKQPYIGVAFAVGNWWTLVYDPIIDKSGKVIGALCAAQALESAPALREAIQTTEVGKLGNVLTLGTNGAKKGKVFISKGAKLDGQIITEGDTPLAKGFLEIVEKAKDLKDGEVKEITVKDTENGVPAVKTITYSYYKPWDWVVAVVADHRDYVATEKVLANGQRQMVYVFIFVGLAIAGLATLVIAGIARKALKPVDELVSISKLVAQGNVNVEIKHTGNDEVGELGNAFREVVDYQKEMADLATNMSNGDLSKDVNPKGSEDVLGNAFHVMTKAFRNLIGALSTNVDEVQSTSGGLTVATDDASASLNEILETINHVGEASDQAASASNEVAKGSEQLAVTANKAAEAMSNLDKAIEIVRASSEEQSATASEATSASKLVTDAVEKTIISMDRIQRQVESSAAEIEDLGTKGLQIGQIVQTIEDIATQTNLLALNAAIEAARAGEQGRGFAVVADEVRKLAERSAEATKEIASLIMNVQANVQQAVESMKAMTEEVSSGAEAGAVARQSLEEIDNAIANVIGATAKVEKSSVTMIKQATDVTDSISSVAAISEESAASAEEMAAAATEVSHQMQQARRNVGDQVKTNELVQKSASDLKKVADEVRALVSQFDSFRRNQANRQDNTLAIDSRSQSGKRKKSAA